MKENSKYFEHPFRSQRDNLLYTVKYGMKSGYYFIEVVKSNGDIKFVIESDEWWGELEDIMLAWGCNERNISSLYE